jgi:hypothetical protein
MGNIKNRRVVAEYTIYGRRYEVERIDWKDSDGLSFDVHDVDTHLCLTAESLDNEPTMTDIEELLHQLAEDLNQNTLDTFHAGDPRLTEVLASVPTGGLR